MRLTRLFFSQMYISLFSRNTLFFKRFLRANVRVHPSMLFINVITAVRKEGKRYILFNDALNTFYLRLYGVRHMVKDHSDSERGNPLPPHGLLFPINSKGSFICTFPQTG